MSQMDVYRYLSKENEFKTVDEIALAIGVGTDNARHSANLLVDKG